MTNSVLIVTVFKSPRVHWQAIHALSESSLVLTSSYNYSTRFIQPVRTPLHMLHAYLGTDMDGGQWPFFFLLGCRPLPFVSLPCLVVPIIPFKHVAWESSLCVPFTSTLELGVWVVEHISEPRFRRFITNMTLSAPLVKPLERQIQLLISTVHCKQKLLLDWY